MENSNVKRENRKALPKFLLMVLGGAVVGGVIGFFSGVASGTDLPAAVTAGMERLLAAIMPWGIPVSSAVLLGGGWVLSRRARKLVRGWDGEDEHTVDEADRLLNWVMLLTSVATILDFFFMAAVGVGSHGSMVSLVVTGCFLVSCAAAILLQQRVVDLTRTMNPEKKGSVYDMQFQKKWFESCDEAEKAQIGQAAYKAYKAGTSACIFLWLALVILSFVFDLGLTPVFTVLVIWGVLQVSYSLECIRMGRHK